MTQAPVSTLQPSLAPTEFIDTTGVFPTESGSDSGPFIGSIGIFAGPSVVFQSSAQGQVLPITGNTPLFSILGTDFGGDGATSFELPNLGGIETIGSGAGEGLPSDGLGQTLGQTGYDLTPAQLPPGLGGTSAAIHTQQPSLAFNYVVNVHFRRLRPKSRTTKDRLRRFSRRLLERTARAEALEGREIGRLVKVHPSNNRKVGKEGKFICSGIRCH